MSTLMSTAVEVPPPPRLARRAVRPAAVILAPEHRAPAHVVASIERLRLWLREDEHWTVTVETKAEGMTLRAHNHRGVFYRNLSPLDRIARGTLTCWSAPASGTRVHRGIDLRFRPDWIAALVDAGLIALAFAFIRGLSSVSGQAPFWPNAAIAFLIIAVGLLMLMPLVRFRFRFMLTRAVWLSDAEWTRLRERGDYWRLAWNVAGGLAPCWLVIARWIAPWLHTFSWLSWYVIVRVYQRAPLAAAKLLLYDAAALAAVPVIAYLAWPNIRWPHRRD